MLVNPDLTVAAVIEARGRFLLVEEWVAGALVVNQPAGHVEDDESLVEAVMREVVEETAWRFRPTAIVGVYLWTHPETGKSFLRAAFCGRCHSHDPDLPLDDGIQRAFWLNRQQLAARAEQLRSPMVLRCIDDFLQGSRHSLDLVTHLDPGQAIATAIVV